MAVIKDRYQLEIDTKGAVNSLNNLKGGLGGIGRLATGIGAVAVAVGAIGAKAVSAAREMEPVTNQLRLITGSSEELQRTLQNLTDAAVANRASFAETADLYTKLSLATADLGVTSDQVLNVTGKFSKALAISGADAGTAAGAIRQFGQAMASGTVRGDEFNSIVEALGPALAIMAQETGIGVGELRRMSQAGELTAETFFKMVEGSRAIETAFASTNKTITQLEQEVADASTKMFAAFASETGLTQAYKDFLNDLARAMRAVAGASTSLEKATLSQLAFNDALGTASERLQEIQDRITVRSGFSGAALSATISEIVDEFEELNNVTAAGDDLTFKQRRRLIALQGSLNEVAKEYNVTVEEIISYVNTLQTAAEAEAKVAEEQKKTLETLKAQRAATEAITGPLQRYNELLEEYAKIDPRTEIEKATDAQAEALNVISALMSAQQELNLETESGRAAFAKIQGDIELAKTAYFEYGQTIDEILAKTQSLSSVDQFFKSLVEGSREAVTEQTNAMLAVERLTDELAAGRINIDVYADAMDRLNSIMGVTADEADDTAHKFQTYSEFVEAADIAIKESIRTDNFKSHMLAELKRQYEEGGLAIEYYKEALKQLDDTFVEVADSEERYRQFAQKAHTAVRESIDTDIFKERMLAELKEQYDNNILSLDEYNRYLKELNGTTKETVDQHEKLRLAIEKTNASTQERIKAAQDESMLDNLRGIERELKSIELQEQRTAAAAKRRIQEQFAGKLSSAELNSALSEIDAATTRSIELQQELAMETYKNQRSFATGWKNAFEEYREAATDNSKLAADVFNRFTRGMEDSIVEFARTGKFSMKDFLADIAEMILRSQVQRLIAQIFGGMNLFGGSGGGLNFAGHKAQGGFIPSGSFGIAGESGPEMVMGPAQVSPIGNNMVTYNINAVDAPSFQQLVARDPGFIHAVSEQGRRAIPAGRR